MPARIGKLIYYKSRKEYECTECKDIIKEGNVYALRVGTKGKIFYSSRLHSSCVNLMLDRMVNEWLSKASEGRIKRVRNPDTYHSRLIGMNEEQKYRRRTLHMYLNHRDKKSLIKAYEQNSTERVFIVMNNMYKRIVELEAMGIEFSASFINKESELKDLIVKYDRYWWDELYDASESNDPNKWKLLVRNTDEGSQPDWRE